MINYLVNEVPLVSSAFLKSLHDSNPGSIFQSHFNNVSLTNSFKLHYNS